MAQERVNPFTEMHKAYTAARADGNNKAITELLVKAQGVSSVHYQQHLSLSENLYKAVVGYYRKVNANSTAPALKKAANEVFEQWKLLLSSAEDDPFTKKLRPKATDLEVLYGFVQRFMNEKNNVDEIEDFVCKKTRATSNFGTFRKLVETEIGCRMFEVEVISEAKQEFLEKQRKALNKIRRHTNNIKFLNDQIKALEAAMTGMTAGEALDGVKARIEELKAQIVVSEGKIEENKIVLQSLVDPDAAVEVEAA